ncbi:MAG: hypothetical protein IAG10_12410 [Planctomycetaceae bacterium]|nr:hypothetical protein [Planctomycetaceae bacterium]
MTVSASLEFEVSYGQLAVFVSSLDKPYNDWTAKHVAQGFSWRPHSVSFRTLAEAGRHAAVVNLDARTGPLHPDTVRAIEVPFDVPEDGAIEIGGIAETIPFSLPPGRYLLRCEFLATENESPNRVHLTFANEESPRFSVVLADAELSDYENILRTAEPASF